MCSCSRTGTIDEKAYTRMKLGFIDALGHTVCKKLRLVFATRPECEDIDGFPTATNRLMRDSV